MLGIATVKPISATMPSTTDPATAQITPRGTDRRGFTASSDMSAASSKPTSVNAPSIDASANEEYSGLWPGRAVLARTDHTYGDGVLQPSHRKKSVTANTTGPTISVNTAMLLTRAATWTLMMFTRVGRIIRTIATASTRWGLAAGSTLNSLTSSGAAPSSMIAPPPTVM